MVNEVWLTKFGFNHRVHASCRKVDEKKAIVSTDDKRMSLANGDLKLSTAGKVIFLKMLTTGVSLFST